MLSIPSVSGGVPAAGNWHRSASLCLPPDVLLRVLDSLSLPLDWLFPSQGKWAEVHIRWKPILDALVARLGGSDPMYIPEETRDGWFQLRVTFTVLLEVPAVNWETISVVGNACSSLCEAESEATAAALQRFSGGCYNTKVIDISHVYCENLKMKGQNDVLKAGELQQALATLLSDWGSCIQQIERSYEPILHEITHGADEKARQIRLKVGHQLLRIKEASQQEHAEFVKKSEAIEIRLREAHAAMREYFDGFLIPRVGNYREHLPSEIRISMKIVLSEMMMSLGWDQPEYTTVVSVGHTHVTEVELQPKGMKAGRITAVGTEEDCKEEAIESGAQAAILHLEYTMAICLIDLNYNKKSHAEERVAEAEKVAGLISSIAAKARAIWESEVENISACDDNCGKMMADHKMKDPSNGEYNIKWDCAEAVRKLYKVCLQDLLFAHRRHQYISTWMEKDQEEVSNILSMVSALDED